MVTIGALDLLAYFAVLSVLGSVSVEANVSQCYHCNSLFCGDPYDTSLAAVASCSDVFKNAQLYSSRIIASAARSGTLKNMNGTQIGTDNSGDIETLSSQNTDEIIRHRTHAEFFDIQRKIWEFFNKGEIDQNTEFVCVKANYNNENGQRKTFRGCVPKNTKSLSTACDFVNQKVAGAKTSTVYGCYTCNSNQCNSGISLRNSMLVLVIGTILKMAL